MRQTDHQGLYDQDYRPALMVKVKNEEDITDWEGDVYQKVWDTESLSWVSMTQPVINATGSNIYLAVDAIETKLDTLHADVDTVEADLLQLIAKEPIVRIGDGANLDAFSRLRISDPVSVFDSTFQYDIQPTLFHASVAGTATIAHEANTSSALMTVSATSDIAILQSKQYHRYIPAKSQLIVMTQVPGAGSTGVRRRMGYFDDFDGIFFEQDPNAPIQGISFVRRTSTAGLGAMVNNRVMQANWNLDKLDGTGASGYILDLSKAMILVIDLQWLGMGRVRCGFDIDGSIVYAHEFLNANVLTVPYMRTANLPIRWELERMSGSGASTMRATCSAVISEGGRETDRGYQFSASNSADISATTSRTHLISIRPKATFNSLVNRIQISPEIYSAIAGNNPIHLELLYNTAVTGGSWVSADANSATEYNITPTSFIGGTLIDSMFVGSAQATRGSVTGSSFPARLPLTLDISGANPINLTLCATSLLQTSATRGRITWKELR